jgi:hypothetical protein
MHPTVIYHLGQCRMADLRRQAQRASLSRTARRASLSRSTESEGHRHGQAGHRRPPAS